MGSSGAVLNGTTVGSIDENSWYNKNHTGKHIMDTGGLDPDFAHHEFMQAIGREGDWSWISRNARYLKFILPKE